MKPRKVRFRRNGQPNSLYLGIGEAFSAGSGLDYLAYQPETHGELKSPASGDPDRTNCPSLMSAAGHDSHRPPRSRVLEDRLTARKLYRICRRYKQGRERTAKCPQVPGP